MGSIRAYTCRQCRGELISTRRPREGVGLPAQGAPVLCCGRPVKRLDTGQALSAPLPRRRTARCPSCGNAVELVVHPEGPLVCTSCRASLEVEARCQAADGATQRSTPQPISVEAPADGGSP